jgi:hypothetical protein
VSRSGGEVLRLGQRMPPTLTGRRRQVGVDVEEARAGDVTFEIQLAAALGRAELPATVDELVAQAYQLPFDGGSGREAGWIT